MNQKQTIALIIGCLLISIHLVLYFSNVQAKYDRLSYERQRLKTDYSQSQSATVKNREESFRKVLWAWIVVSVFLVFGLGLSLWLYRKKPRRASQIIICLFIVSVLWL